MSRNSKTGVVSAALIIGVLSGCAEIEDEYDNIVGINRTTPEGSDVNFGNRHAPILNNVIPGGAGSNNAGAPDIYSPQSAQRRVPIENTAPSGDPSSDNTVGSGIKAPALASVPVAPVAAAAVPAPVDSPIVAASNTPYPTLANVPPAPVTPPKEQSAAELNALTADRNLSESGRKQLMSDPGATVMTSPQTGQLVDNAADAVTPQVPVPPVALAQPAPAAAPPAPAPQPQAAKEDKGFNNWLHHLFPSDNQGNAAPVNPAARATPSENPVPAAASVPSPAQPHDVMANSTAPAAAEPMANASVPAPSPAPVNSPDAAGVVYLPPAPFNPEPPAIDAAAARPVPPAVIAADAPVPPAAAEMEPVHLHPPAVASDVPAPSAPPPLSVPAPPVVTADASVPPAATAMEPVHLHPPASMAADDQSLSAASSEPITLVPPSASPQTRYLPDSRYAARRMSTPADGDSNND